MKNSIQFNSSKNYAGAINQAAQIAAFKPKIIEGYKSKHERDGKIKLACGSIGTSSLEVAKEHFLKIHKDMGFADIQYVDNHLKSGPYYEASLQPGWKTALGNDDDYIFDAHNNLRITQKYYTEHLGLNPYFCAQIHNRLEICGQTDYKNQTTIFYLTDKTKPVFVFGTFEGTSNDVGYSTIKNKLNTILLEILPDAANPCAYWEVENMEKRMTMLFAALNQKFSNPVTPEMVI